MVRLELELLGHVGNDMGWLIVCPQAIGSAWSA
jgi:hypothetical protein